MSSWNECDPADDIQRARNTGSSVKVNDSRYWRKGGDDRQLLNGVILFSAHGYSFVSFMVK